MKKYEEKLLLLTDLILCGFYVIAAQNTTIQLASFKEKVNRAIIKFENTNEELWSYKISRYEDEEGDISSRIEQHSPQSSSRWLLKQINGAILAKQNEVKMKGTFAYFTDINETSIDNFSDYLYQGTQIH
jgi:hypothetical protein